jgi:hypothetical protein
MQIKLRALFVLFSLLIPAPAWAGDVAGALSFVPSDAFAVLGGHVERLRRSPHADRLLKELLDGEEAKLEELKKQTGFDLRRDVRAALIAVRPKAGGRGEHSVVIAEAAIEEAKLVAFLRRQGKKVEARKGPGGTFYRTGSNDALALRGGFVIAGDEPAVRAALSKRGPSPELTQLLKSVQQRDLFFAARPTAEQRRELARDKPELAEMRSLRGGADVGTSLRADAVLEVASPEAARRLHRQAQAALAVIGMTPEARDFSDILNALTIEASGREVRARLQLSQAQLKRLLDLLAALK